MNRRRILTVFTCLVATLAFMQPVSAQVLGSISGFVTDDSGAALPGVQVEAVNADTGARRAGQTNAAGFYNLEALVAGNYNVTAMLDGFQGVRQEGVTVQLAQNVTIAMRLAVGSVEDTITVTGETPAIEVSRSSAAAYITEQEVLALPNAGRDFKDLALLTPTVQADPIRGFITMSGQRGIYSGMNIDGTDGKSAFFGYGAGGEATENDGLVVAQDSVREFQVITNGFAPEYGENGGGYLNVITQSGTNDLKGSAFYFLRDDSMATDIPGSEVDASRGIDGSAPVNEFSRDNYGFSLGGPIKKDKTHFFFSWDGTVRDEPFKDTLRTRGAYDAILLQAQTNPDFLTLVDGYTPNDDGIAAPDPDLGRTASGTFLRSVDNQIYFGKIDHQFGDSNSFSLRGNITSYERTSTFQDEESLKVEDTTSWVASLVSIVGASGVNEARIQVATDDLDRLSQRVGQPIEAELRFRFGSTDSVGKFDFLPILVEEEKTQIQESFSYLFGDHDMKFGLDYHEDSLAQLFAGSLDGRYDYGSMEDFLNNNASQVRFYFGDVTFPNYDEKQEITAVYAQDSWKPRSNLSINYGFRFSQTNNPSGLEHVFPVGRNIPDDNNNFGPRFGFAWTPEGDTTSVLRGGIGLFFGRTPTLLFASQIQENGIFPNFGRVTVRPGDIGFVPFGQPVDNENPPPDTIPSTSYLDGNFKDQETLRFNLGYEREVLDGWTAGTDLVYAEGSNLQRNFNDQHVVTGHDSAGRPIYSGDIANPDFNTIFVRRSNGESEYTALTLKMGRRYNGKYQINAHYTWSEDKDMDSNERSATSVTVGDPTNLRYDWGLSERDVTNRFLVSGLVDVGWGVRVSGIIEYRDGTPYTAEESEFNAAGYPFTTAFGPTSRAVINGSVVGRNTYRNDSISKLDLRVTKGFSIGDRVDLDLFIEGFNLLNENTFFVSGSQLDPTTGGGANSEFGLGDNLVTTPRQYQIGVRVNF